MKADQTTSQPVNYLESYENLLTDELIRKSEIYQKVSKPDVDMARYWGQLVKTIFALRGCVSEGKGSVNVNGSTFMLKEFEISSQFKSLVLPAKIKLNLSTFTCKDVLKLAKPASVELSPAGFKDLQQRILLRFRSRPEFSEFTVSCQEQLLTVSIPLMSDGGMVTYECFMGKELPVFTTVSENLFDEDHFCFKFETFLDKFVTTFFEGMGSSEKKE